MRSLVLLRGVPGSGKSHFVEKQGWKEYTLEPDAFRIMCDSLVYDINGQYSISQHSGDLVWKTLFEVLEHRMAKGIFTVIDATNIKTTDMKRFKDLAVTYRYRIYVVDFTDVPIELCKKQNAMRPEFKRVPESVIENMYAKLATQTIPSGIKVLKREEANQILFKTIDLSEYKAVHNIGDIHGCYTVLKKYLDSQGGIKEDEFYIFCGDYFDRGIENAEALSFINKLSKRKNVLLLEGNHERHLADYGAGKTSLSKEFENRTRPEIEKSFSQKDARILYRGLGQCAWYTYHGKRITVTHGGIPCEPSLFVNTEQMIKGVGKYDEADEVDDAFFENTPDNAYSIHGHRNIHGSGIQVNDKCFNLENAVEFGGCLRVVKVSENGFETFEVENPVYRTPNDDEISTMNIALPDGNIKNVVKILSSSKSIKRKDFGNISSFNFTREAFQKAYWNDATIKARGLFINRETNKVVNRGYEKFFKIDERPETSLDALRANLVFPVTAYVKENGFLGLLGYDEETDELLFCSKSTVKGEYANYFRTLFEKGGYDIAEVKKYLKENNKAMAFEVIDIINDPHIIEYPNSKIVLLDIIDRQIAFKKLPYQELCDVASRFGFEVKEQAYIFNSWEEFFNWYVSFVSDGLNYTYIDKYIEGFVIEDSTGFMFKLKSVYYNTWKFMRSVAETTLKVGHYRYTSSFNCPLHNDFYAWVKSKYEVPEIKNGSIDIISLRKKFLSETQICGNCKNFTGIGDWNLSCTEKHNSVGYPFGHICYANTPACEKFKPIVKTNKTFTEHNLK